MARSQVQNLARARSAITEHGALLVYPLANRRDPPSLWHALYPRTEMRWSWDEGADERVAGLWHLREQLAREKQVVYGKWFRGRAIFVSRELFVPMLALSRADPRPLSVEAREILALLIDDSPQTTKRLRREAALTGRDSERVWTRAMRELWERFLIVGVGELDDGSFPSLLVGATRLIFEELWEAAEAEPSEAQRATIEEKLGTSPAFASWWRRLRTS